MRQSFDHPGFARPRRPTALPLSRLGHLLKESDTFAPRRRPYSRTVQIVRTFDDPAVSRVCRKADFARTGFVPDPRRHTGKSPVVELGRFNKPSDRD
jgi:hypothetical protein